MHADLTTAGFSLEEATLAHWAYWYALEYNRRSQDVLTGGVLAHYPAEIKVVMFFRATDGYFALYETGFPEGLREQVENVPPEEAVAILAFDRKDETVSEVIQSYTKNHLRVLVPNVSDAVEQAWEPPPDVPNSSDVLLSPALRGDVATLPVLDVLAAAEVEQGHIARVCPGRVHAVSPVIQTPDGPPNRQFTWLFADFWFGELTREALHLSNTVHFLLAELQVLQWTMDLALPPQDVVSNATENASETIRRLLVDFEQLLNKPGVDEKADIQPFLADPKHWILLSPSRKHVWPEKELGNKWRVDFLVRESDDSYTAVEIESPNFPLFTKALDPHHKLTHAEQQVRDYCEYIDQNRDTVEREEGLTKVFRPRGVVVIGRRRTLSDDATRKLVARNRDAGRYTVMVYDDLIDRVASVLSAIEAAM